MRMSPCCMWPVSSAMLQFKIDLDSFRTRTDPINHRRLPYTDKRRYYFSLIGLG